MLVRGASQMAARLGMTSLVIGLTVVAFGTSAPELAISLQSGFEGKDALLLGNVIGSNIFNTLFILGLSAIIVPLFVSKNLVKLDVPLMIVMSIVLYVFAFDGAVDRIEGIILFSVLIGYIFYLIYDSRSKNRIKKSQNNTSEAPAPSHHGFWDIVFVIVGLLFLIIGARWLVDSAVIFAESIGVSSLVIGLTIVAFGTSLPEVATSVMASLKGERDLAVGNIVGSNLFNIMCIMGLSAIILPHDITVPTAVLGFDLPIMIATAVICLPIFFTGNIISRWEGILFVGYYIAFTVYLILTATDHHLLPLFTMAMEWFVIPMTVFTGFVAMVKEVET